MKAISLLLALSLAGVSAGPAQSQEYAVTRRSFTFLDDHLDIDVQAMSAGQLQVVRGEQGRIDVAAHSTEGVASFGLASEHGSILTLTALGAKQAEYVVVVPENTAVRVRLPGRSSWGNASSFGTARFRWDSVPEPPATDYSIPRPGLENKYFLIAVPTATPARLRLLGRSHIRSVELRMEGTEFEIGSTRPLANSPGVADLLDIDAGNEDVDLMVQVPAYTKQFDLWLDKDVLVTVRDGVVTDNCRPSVRQTTVRGTLRVTYRPASGVECDARGYVHFRESGQ